MIDLPAPKATPKELAQYRSISDTMTKMMVMCKRDHTKQYNLTVHGYFQSGKLFLTNGKEKLQFNVTGGQIMDTKGTIAPFVVEITDAHIKKWEEWLYAS